MSTSLAKTTRIRALSLPSCVSHSRSTLQTKGSQISSNTSQRSQYLSTLSTLSSPLNTLITSQHSHSTLSSPQPNTSQRSQYLSSHLNTLITSQHSHHLSTLSSPLNTLITSQHSHSTLSSPQSNTLITSEMPFTVYLRNTTLSSPKSAKAREAALDAVILSINKWRIAIGEEFGIRNWVVVLL